MMAAITSHTSTNGMSTPKKGKDENMKPATASEAGLSASLIRSSIPSCAQAGRLASRLVNRTNNDVFIIPVFVFFPAIIFFIMLSALQDLRNNRDRNLGDLNQCTGDTAEQTVAYSEQLCNSQKEQLEHKFVCDDIRSALSGICDSVRQGEQRVVQLKNLQHLFTEFTARLKHRVCDYDILNALHPTAAVCGLPRKDAMEWIKKCESFSRGFYAGPFGYISAQQSEFAVAIRSAAK